ncbi:MAG: membrane protein [Candidatus Hydrogenedentota bacterium]
MPFRTSNPAMRPLADSSLASYDAARMTVQGTVNKTGILLVLVVGAAGFVWSRMNNGNPEAMYPWIIGGMIGGLIVGLATSFKPGWAPVTAPIYAVLEGLFIGGLSAVMNAQFQGIVLPAVVLTFGVMFVMLALYTTGIIKVTERFKMGVIAATGAVMLFYLVNFLLSFAGWNFGFVHQGGVVGIGFSLFVVGLAALNLVLDFAFIDEAAESGAPKTMEWYGAFALLVTLVWLYIEILRLLAKFQRR